MIKNTTRGGTAAHHRPRFRTKMNRSDEISKNSESNKRAKLLNLMIDAPVVCEVRRRRHRRRPCRHRLDHKATCDESPPSPPAPQSQGHRPVPFKLLKLLSTLTIVIIATLALAPGDPLANCFEFDRATPPRDVTTTATASTMYDLFALPAAGQWSQDDLLLTSASGHGPSLRRQVSKRATLAIDSSKSSQPAPQPTDTVHLSSAPRASHLANESNSTRHQVTTSSSSTATAGTQELLQVSSSDNQDDKLNHQDQPQVGESQQEQQQEQPPPAYKWYMILPVILMFVGATGNILVCMAVLRERRLQTATNYFLLSLACADLLVCTLVMPFGIVYEFYGRWPFDWRICNLWVTCDVLTCSSSILHMCCISVGRYIGIRNPLHARQANLFVSRRAVLWRIAIAWIASVFITSPITLMSIHNHANIVPAPGQCAIANKSFMVFGSLFAFFIPMFVMVPSYVMTVRLLSRRAKFVRNDSILMAANQQHEMPNGFVAPRAKASSAGDCSPQQQTDDCNNVKATGGRRGPKRAARYSSPSRTRGFSSTDLEATGAPSQVEMVTGGRQPPPPATDVLRRTQKNFWAGLLADVNNNSPSEKDNQPKRQGVQPNDSANQRPPNDLKQPLLPEKLEESIKSCRFIDDDDCESGASEKRRGRPDRGESDSEASQSDCASSSSSSVATIVERDANQLNGQPANCQTKEQPINSKEHDDGPQRCGPRNACSCAATAAAKDKTCPAKAKRTNLKCTSASAVDNRARCASRSSSTAKVDVASATGRARGARRALWPVESTNGRDECARSQSCTTCSLLDDDIDIASDRNRNTPTKQTRRCLSSLATTVNGYSSEDRVPGNHDGHNDDDKFDDRACEPASHRLLDTSGRGTATNDSINGFNNMAREQAPSPLPLHKANLCANSCGCLHTNGYASRGEEEEERQQTKLRRRPPQTVIMPAIALNDHCLANDSSPWGEEGNEKKIHHSNYQSQSSGQQHCCHHKQDNGSRKGCCCCCCSSHRAALCVRHHRRSPGAGGDGGDALSMKCTISCTMCTNCVRTHRRHHHHRHRHRRRPGQEESRAVCLCTNKRRQGTTPSPGSRSARVQHAHRKSPSGHKTENPKEPPPVLRPANPIKVKEDKERPDNHEGQANKDQARHMGGSVIFKVPVASSGEKQQQPTEGANRPALTSISQRPQAAPMTGNGQLAQANNHLPHLRAGQRVHGGREPPQMIRYLGSSMQVRSEQKATRVLGGVFFFFIFCWTPFFFSNFLSGILERDLLSQYIPDSLMTCFLWLGYSSSTVNPIIYTVANRNFRRAFVRLLLCREPVGRRQYRQSRSSEYYKSFRFSQYPTARPPVILDKE